MQEEFFFRLALQTLFVPLSANLFRQSGELEFGAVRSTGWRTEHMTLDNMSAFGQNIGGVDSMGAHVQWLKRSRARSLILTDQNVNFYRECFLTATSY